MCELFMRWVAVEWVLNDPESCERLTTEQWTALRDWRDKIARDRTRSLLAQLLPAQFDAEREVQ